jgi:hypothetical protein
MTVNNNINIKNEENIDIKESLTVTLRTEDFRCFWFIVKNSLEQIDNVQDQLSKRSFLLNSAVMAVMTLESLLNDLGEFYLPINIWECIDSERETKKRFEKNIKELTGQYSEYKIKRGNTNIKINKIDLNNFFKKSKWSKVCELIKIRNKIVHRKVEDEAHMYEDGDRIVGSPRNNWEFNEEDIEPLINDVKDFILELKKLFKLSIEDPLDNRLLSRFDFLNNNT